MQNNGPLRLHVGRAWMIQDDSDISIRVIGEANAIPFAIAFGLSRKMIREECWVAPKTDEAHGGRLGLGEWPTKLRFTVELVRVWSAIGASFRCERSNIDVANGVEECAAQSGGSEPLCELKFKVNWFGAERADLVDGRGAQHRGPKRKVRPPRVGRTVFADVAVEDFESFGSGLSMDVYSVGLFPVCSRVQFAAGNIPFASELCIIPIEQDLPN